MSPKTPPSLLPNHDHMHTFSLECTWAKSPHPPHPLRASAPLCQALLPPGVHGFLPHAAITGLGGSQQSGLTRVICPQLCITISVKLKAGFLFVSMFLFIASHSLPERHLATSGVTDLPGWGAFQCPLQCKSENVNRQSKCPAGWSLQECQDRRRKQRVGRVTYTASSWLYFCGAHGNLGRDHSTMFSRASLWPQKARGTKCSLVLSYTAGLPQL